MKYTVVCNESNNGDEQEILDTVVADFRFEGVDRVYRVEFEIQTREQTFKEARQRFFEEFETRIRQVPDQQVADEICELHVKSEQAYRWRSP